MLLQGWLACLLPCFFCLLGDTAEHYFSPIMSQISQVIPKMRPRFAGGAGGPRQREGCSFSVRGHCVVGLQQQQDWSMCMPQRLQ
jgi:hypothetical protein